MSTTSARRRKPVVFLLVYGAFLILIAITAAGHAAITSSNLSRSFFSSVATANDGLNHSKPGTS